MSDLRDRFNQMLSYRIIRYIKDIMGQQVMSMEHVEEKVEEIMHYSINFHNIDCLATDVGPIYVYEDFVKSIPFLCYVLDMGNEEHKVVGFACGNESTFLNDDIRRSIESEIA
jgi:hypothetical protein